MKLQYLSLFVLALFFSCTNALEDVTVEEDQQIVNEEEEDNNGGILATLGVTVCDFAPYSVGSTFEYKGDVGEFVITVTGNQNINGTDYAILENSIDGSLKYYNCENGVYNHLTYVPDPNGPNGSQIEELYVYLKEDAPGESWQNDLINGGNHVVSFLELEPFRIVNNIVYEDVIGIEVKITNDPNNPPTSFDNTHYFWYAKDVGLIETTLGNVQLKTHTIN